MHMYLPNMMGNHFVLKIHIQANYNSFFLEIILIRHDMQFVGLDYYYMEGMNYCSENDTWIVYTKLFNIYKNMQKL